MADGSYAMYSNLAGSNSVAVGYSALYSSTTGGYNVAVGEQALLVNPSGSYETAVGYRALYSSKGSEDTAVGDLALFNSTGGYDTAIGAESQFTLTTGSYNASLGAYTLLYNGTGSWNTAIGYDALFNSTVGDNTAVGAESQLMVTSGSENASLGDFSLLNNTTGNANTAIGSSALRGSGQSDYENSTAVGANALEAVVATNGDTAIGANAMASMQYGEGNLAIGVYAGSNNTNGEFDIYIGDASETGEADDPTTEDRTIRIGKYGLQDQTFIQGLAGGAAVTGYPIFVDPTTGRVGEGVMASSRRFKQNIKSMDAASEPILALKPVTFQYKPNMDPKGTPQFGLVAEEVDKVCPALVVKDAKGLPAGVRYDAVNAMLLNEFLKEHKKVEDLEAIVARQTEAMKSMEASVKAQGSLLQKVSTQLELQKTTPRVVAETK